MKGHKVVGVLVILLAVGVSLFRYFCFEKSFVSQNVEALSQQEHGIYVHCYDYIKADPTDNVMYCGTCSMIPGTWRGGMNFCTNQ